MGRQLPTECDECHGIVDPGDFGAEATCTCPVATSWTTTNPNLGPGNWLWWSQHNAGDPS